MKIIDTIKYYQSSLAKIASTVTEYEKNKISQLTLQFLTRYTYFGQVWKILTNEVREKILDIIAEGKGIIPYEKIINMGSLDLAPEKDFFEESEFYSSLNQKTVTKADYESSKYLFENLKMRNLSDMNDLYNMQDIIPLLKIVLLLKIGLRRCIKSISTTLENVILLAL